MIPRLKTLPAMALKKNTREGENRSARVSKEKIKVPMIKPNCTAEVRFAKASELRWNALERSFITPFPANQREVQQNWAKTIVGKTRLVLFVMKNDEIVDGKTKLAGDSFFVYQPINQQSGTFHKVLIRSQIHGFA